MNNVVRTGVDGLGPLTRFAGLPRGLAVLALLALALSMLVCGGLVREAGHPGRGPKPGMANQGDMHLFGVVVERIRAGEGYYEAFGDEARRRGYGTRSVLNWRTPLHLSLLGRIPGPPWRIAFFGSLAIAASSAAFLVMERDGGFRVAATHAVLLAVILLISSIGHLFAESWAGTLIILSIGLAALGWRGASVAAGLLALFTRELALPYVAIALWLAWREGRRGEAFAWVAGLAAYLIYFALHAARVLSMIGDADVAYPSGWLRWGGPLFVLRTATFGPLRVLPTWVTMCCIPLAILGMAGWRGPLGRRVSLTAASYAILFCAVGKAFNDYWGLMYSPLLSFGIAWAPAALRDLRNSCSMERRDSGRSIDHDL